MCMFCGGTGAGPQGGLLAFNVMDEFRKALCGLETRHRTLLRRQPVVHIEDDKDTSQQDQKVKDLN